MTRSWWSESFVCNALSAPGVSLSSPYGLSEGAREAALAILDRSVDLSPADVEASSFRPPSPELDDIKLATANHDRQDPAITLIDGRNDQIGPHT
jgi:hypothetical protein